ncbi:MAG: NADH-quinone oxidoreductase subunit C [Ancalomicrobiaceae bacterium]|nr:NADH-quinone oxidoreductase subunit C [Ancalomicrobiaceae bacterium]
MSFAEIAPVAHHHPWPRRIVDAGYWRDIAGRLAAGEWGFLALWGDTGAVHLAFLEATTPATVSVATLPCPEGRFPSVAKALAVASRPERAIRDLFGLEPIGANDERHWLDHGRWPGGRPFAAPAPGDAEDAAGAAPGLPPYRFLDSTGPGLHQIPVGPVHAGIIEPGHFRFTCNGETIVRLEERLGYVHKGLDRLLAGSTIERAAKLAARISGDSTVAYSFAFALAVENALGVKAPPRAEWQRALMAELERLANHLGDIGAVCNDAAYAIMLAHCSSLREQVLRTAETAFGHRLMMDGIQPGGVAVELKKEGAAAVRGLIKVVRAQFPELVELYDNTASLADRTVATGRLDPALAAAFSAGGFVGRASGRSFDARRDLPYAPYDRLHFEVPVMTEGDVNARVWIRIKEVEQSLDLIEQILAGMPTGATTADLLGHIMSTCEGLAVVEGFRGDILASVRISADGTIERAYLRDPSWAQWPLLEAAIEGNIVADFPLCNKSFNCSYSGHDL